MRRYALAAVVVLGAGLRFATLDVQSFWYDEAVTVGLVRLGLFDMLGEIPASESTPPLYYVVAWFWSKVLGNGEPALRSLSALLGTATIPVAWAAARRLADDRAGLIAAALIAFSPLLVWYSQEARAYALLVFLVAVGSLGFAHAVRGDGPRWLALWGIASALALATHYFAGFVVAAEAVWLWRALPDRRRETARAGALPALAALALLPLAIAQASNDGAAFIEGTALGTRLLQIPKQLLTGFDAPAEAAWTAAAVVLAAIGAWLAFGRAGRKDDAVPVGDRSGAASQTRGAGATPVAAVAALALAAPLLLAPIGLDYVLTRNLIAALFLALIALALGLAAARAPQAGAAIAAGLCLLGAGAAIAVAVEPRYQRDDWRSAAEALGPPAGPRLVVVSPAPGVVPLRVYLDGAQRAGAGPTWNAREVALVGLSPRGPDELREPPRPGAVPPPAPGFREVRRVESETFTVILFRAPAPEPVSRVGVEAIRLAEGPAALLTQQPPG